MDKALIKQKIKSSVLSCYSDAQVILFGSKARGTDTAESDWDILVLLNQPTVTFKDEQYIKENVYDIELEVEEPISLFVYSLPEWNTRMALTPFYNNIKRDGIIL